MRKTFVFILLIACSLRIIAQNKCSCEESKESYTKISLYLDQKEYKKAESLLTAKKETEINCRIEQLQLQTQLFSLKSQFNDADSCLKRLKKLVMQNKCSSGEARYYIQAGFLLMRKNLHDSAMTQLVRANELSSLAKDTIGEFTSLMHIGNLFNIMRQSDKAINYDRKALTKARLLGEPAREARILCNMQAHFGVLFDETEDPKFLDSARLVTKKTLALAKEYGLRTEMAQTYSVLAGLAYTEAKYKRMLDYTDSALLYLDRNKDFRFCLSVFHKKCDAYIELKDYKRAKEFADSSLRFAALENNPLSIALAYERLYEVEKLSGNPDQALFYHERYTFIRDSIRTVDKTKIINEMEQKYSKAENEKKIKELAYENEIDTLRIRSLIGIVTAIIFLLIVIIFFYRQSVIKNKLKSFETEQRLNRARMNPHFFFNVLVSIQTLILEEENPTRIAMLVSKFSRIMRQALESTYTEWVTIDEEMNFIQNYLDIQKMRYEGKFEYELHISDELDSQLLKVPGMLLQPFVENAIEHGFKNISYTGLLKINFEIENNLIKIVCSDNGKGLGRGEKHKEFPSRAMQIVKERLEILNRQFKVNEHFGITSNGDRGTTVFVYLPIIEQS